MLRLVRSFLVEAYLGNGETHSLVVAARCARAAESDGTRYFGSLAIAEEEVCFHLFASRSARALESALTRAALDYDRIVDAIWIPNRPHREGGTSCSTMWP